VSAAVRMAFLAAAWKIGYLAIIVLFF
jgi:hypothetical protein